jgi:hypothetical protein
VAPGDIVHYNCPDDGEIRPAMVTKVHDENCANLQVFLDGTLDSGKGITTNTLMITSVVRGDEKGQWNPRAGP